MENKKETIHVTFAFSEIQLLFFDRMGLDLGNQNGSGKSGFIQKTTIFLNCKNLTLKTPRKLLIPLQSDTHRNDHF